MSQTLTKYQGKIEKMQLNNQPSQLASLFTGNGFQRYSYITIGGETISNVLIENSLVATLENTDGEVKLTTIGHSSIKGQAEDIFVVAAEAGGKTFIAKEQVNNVVDQANQVTKIMSWASTGFLIGCLLMIPLFGIGLFFLLIWLPFYLLVGRPSKKQMKKVKQFKADVLAASPA